MRVICLTVAAIGAHLGLCAPVRSQNVPSIPTLWNVEDGTNVKWSAALGSLASGAPVIAGGKVFIGTTYIADDRLGHGNRVPNDKDQGVLLALDEQTGAFLWQYSPAKKMLGLSTVIMSSVFVEGNRAWFVTNRNELVCLDTEGFLDNEDDDPVRDPAPQANHDADVVWSLDLMGHLGMVQEGYGCSLAVMGDTLFICTSASEEKNPKAPSFVAVHKNKGHILWSDSGASAKAMRDHCSSPTCAMIGDQMQVLFPGADGWLYSFDPTGVNGKSKLLWKFDCNPKDAAFDNLRNPRSPLIGAPAVYDGRVFVAVGTPAIRKDLLVLADTSGLVHCLDANTGSIHWTYDLLAECSSSPLIVGNSIYIADKDGDVCILALAKQLNVIAENKMGDGVFATPVVANNVLYIAQPRKLFAIVNSQPGVVR